LEKIGSDEEETLETDQDANSIDFRKGSFLKKNQN